MGIFLRTEWREDRSASLEARKRQTTDLLADRHLHTIAGGQWYELGLSQQEALLRSVNVFNPSVPKPWEEVRLTKETRLHRLTLWNGTDDEYGVEVSISLRDPPGEDSDTFVVSLTRPQLLRKTQIAWEEILALGRTLSKELKGLTIFSSGDLVKIAEKRNLPNPDASVYAAFWGTDPQHEIVVARSWDEAFNPDFARLQEAIELLTRQWDIQNYW